MTERLTYPGFTYPDDWRPSPSPPLSGPASKHTLAVDEASRNHTSKHSTRTHPWCFICESSVFTADLDSGLEFEELSATSLQHRIDAATARTRVALAELGDLDKHQNLVDHLVQIVNTTGLAPVDVEALTAEHDVEDHTVAAALAYATAVDELQVAQWRLAEQQRAVGVCLSRANRWLQLHQDRLPVDHYDPDLDDGEEHDAYTAQVAAEAHRLRVRDDAGRLYSQQRANEQPAGRYDAALLGDVLARPEEPPHRVAGLIPTSGSTLLVAQHKVGKTTWTLNLARSLITGTDFLGTFRVDPVVGRVAILNFEVSPAQFARWADEAGIDHDRLALVNVRGKRNPLSNPTDRAQLAAELRKLDVEALFVDPFTRAYTGTSHNDPGEVGAWLTDLEQFARTEVGAQDLLLTHHAGWDGERARGSTALADWADSIITLVHGKNDDPLRYMSAIGRDVEVPEDALMFDQATRTLTLTGSGSRRTRASAAAQEELVDAVVDIVTANPGMTGANVEEALRRSGVSFQKGAERKALGIAMERGLVRVVPGKRNAKHWYPTENPQPPQASPTLPGGAAPQPPQPPLKGGLGGVAALGDAEPPHPSSETRTA